MKKKKLPKYVQQLFKKPQFKIGEIVKYNFLGEIGWGRITKIRKDNDKVTYMVKGNGYVYPCGIQIKEYSSYYAGAIDYETSKNRSDNEQTGVSTTKTRTNNQTRKRLSGSNSNSVSDTRLNIGTKTDIRNGNEQYIKPDSRSKKSAERTELDKEFDKQKNFLRKFT